MPFTHRETIETDSPIIQAAFEIAKKAHKDSGQMRGKAGLPYLVHPIMLYDLLVFFGETDEVTLAAALLHDAKEDLEEYVANPDAMRLELQQKLQASGLKDAEPIAHYLDGICTELCNDKVMFEGKRTWQVDHVGHISLRASKVKIFDQMASVLDNIISPDDAVDGSGNRWSQDWSYKALDVVKAVAEQRPQLDFYRDMFKVLFKYNMSILDADPEAAARLRNAFDWEKAVTEAHRLHETKTPDAPCVYASVHPRPNDIEFGVVGVQFDAEGNVAKYSILSNPLSDKNDPRNAAAIQLMGRLERSKTERRITVGPREIFNGRIVRTNKVKPTMPLDQFIALARESDALDRSFEVEIRDEHRVRNAAEAQL